MPFVSPETLQAIRGRVRRLLVRINRRVPPGARAILGLLLIIGGIFGFLPVLGFWMIPLGVGVVWLDVRAWRRRGWRRGP
ncbi:hypothetical protein OU426_05035 [Frigidibacter sp. RF13]|uniref:hypothetical protein n=1 Tax=Frigidibacter sp. RF13 TaxID=2997340 RepID=UPI00226E20F8|nr:hypothetical protein [Frigidibacter sp. RF13]MCY1126212.1 hypothetical protein [Frigidibacter sp. RF13]